LILNSDAAIPLENVFLRAKAILFTGFVPKPVYEENSGFLAWNGESHDFEHCPLCQLQILVEWARKFGLALFETGSDTGNHKGLGAKPHALTAGWKQSVREDT
jgi:hypothetical protein